MKLPVILGPTCIGKTSLALEIAKSLNADILSIDSRQVFKGLDIGTGKFKGNQKVDKYDNYWEIEGVRVWGYDLLLPGEELNVLKFCKYAQKIIEDCRGRGKKLIATCGTGFYLDFLSGEIFYNDIDEKRKEELHKKSLQELNDLVLKYNIGSDLDLQNKLRVITKILSFESKSVQKHNFKINDLEFYNFYLTGPREQLYKNADLFTKEILNQGVIEEFTENKKIYGETRSLDGLIYKDIAEFIEGKILFNEMESRIKFSLHAYIRRQETYFKKMKVYFKSENKEEIAYKIREIL